MSSHATKKRSGGPVAPANSLVDDIGPQQTIENRREVLDLCRCVDREVITGSLAEHGLYLIVGLVIEALDHAGAEANRLRMEVARAKETNSRALDRQPGRSKPLPHKRPGRPRAGRLNIDAEQEGNA